MIYYFLALFPRFSEPTDRPIDRFGRSVGRSKGQLNRSGDLVTLKSQTLTLVQVAPVSPLPAWMTLLLVSGKCLAKGNDGNSLTR